MNITCFFKKTRGAAIETKMAPPYIIIFMGDLEGRILKDCNFKPLVWWRNIDDILFLWQHGKEKLKEFLDILNCYHPSFKFNSKYSRERIDFLGVELIKEGNQLLTGIFVKSTDNHQYLHATSCHVCHSKNPYPTVRLCVLTRFAPRINFLIRGVII